ncbi:MAG TPA: NADH-quinone oxidoreductase subunit L [Polyangiaceae bacterium]|nr:NADH-quinone oxidoreductase subunit L [Polyangiaceae bacterium]
MQAIEALFPAHNYTLLAFIVLLPLLGAVVNGVFGKRLGKEAVSLLALSVMFVAFALAVVTFLALGHAQEGEEAARFAWQGWEWFRLTRADGSTIVLNVGLSVDALNGTMALVVTGVGFLIHLYSVSYMAEDPGFHRFLAYLNLFIFSMLVLILGDSLPVLFVGWEGVGLCSYLLIGFWFEDDKNAAAGKKAFVTNRIGDFGLLVAMGLLLYFTGGLDWSTIDNGARGLLQPVQIWPLGTHVPAASLIGGSFEQWINMPRTVSAATLVGLALFLGCAGKSAQLPLYVWLPDAMAGPTPVSALIHAATMVTAGVYLLCRLSFVMVLSPAAMATVAVVGAATAMFSASIAFAQQDIKKVLAYSTVSQLGYMFLGVGVGAFTAGFFHVITHAFFKACMFLGAGSVIHAMHARIHDTDASQDMRNMGGLRKYMPITFWTFTAAWAAIVGLPFTSGFFSKDEILLRAFTSFVKTPVKSMSAGGGLSMEVFVWPTWLGTALYAMGLLTALMTAFYMTRLYIGTFFGEFRGWKIVKNWKEPEHAHGHDDHGHGHHHAHDPSVPLEGPTPHESPWQMWVPLAILGFLAAVAGFLNAPLFHLTPFEHWLEPVFEKASHSVQLIDDWERFEYPFLGLAFLSFAGGSGIAYFIYVMQKGKPAQAFVEAMPGLHALVVDKWRVDEIYEEYVIGAVDSLAEFFAWADKWIVDFLLARVSTFLVSISGTALRFIQTGRVQTYAAVTVLGLGAMGWFFVTPRAEATVLANDESGVYSLTAAQGLGYSYRWDMNNDGKWDGDKGGFGNTTQQSLNLAVKENRTVRLEVKNAFGRTAVRSFNFERPAPDRSGLTSQLDNGSAPLRRAQDVRQPSKPQEIK